MSVVRDPGQHNSTLQAFKKTLDLVTYLIIILQIKEWMNSNFERTLIKVETKATNSTTGTESRPATARTSLVYSSNAKGDQANERKIKLLNKTLKSLRVDITNLQKENNHMKKVR